VTIAYLVIAHEDTEQVSRLLGALDQRGSVVAVLLDAASPRAFRSAVRARLGELKHAQTFELKPRHVVWGGISLGLVYLDGMRELLALNARWRYFVPVSGRCLPTQSHEALLAFLLAHEGTNFAESECLVTEAPRHLDRVDRYHIPVVLPGIRTTIHTRFSRPLPSWFSLQKGSAWTMLHRSFCEEATRSPLAKRIARHMRWSFVADELLVQSILMSGPFASTIDRDARRYIDFEEGARHPRVLTMRDLPTLQNGRYFFARKFDRRVDGEVIDALVASLP
jgi:hypothetical protein